MAQAAAAKPPKPAVGTFECKAVGTVSADNTAALQELLTGLSGLPGLSVLQHVMVLKGPQHERSAPELRLLHILASLPLSPGEDPSAGQVDQWLVRHEALPLRGRGVSELPASVRSVTMVPCDSADVLAFWQALGFRLDHELVQEGHRYALATTHQLEVLVARVFKLEIHSSLDSRVELSPDHLYVEVTATGSEGEHAAACIGSLAETLAPLCELRKP